MNRIITGRKALLQTRRGFVVLLFLFLSACGTTVKSVLIAPEATQTRPPDMIGKITEMTWIGDFGIYWEITVEEESTDTTPGTITAEDTAESAQETAAQETTTVTATLLRKYRVTILETSQLFSRSTESTETEPVYADYGDLAREQRVEIWFRGKFLETDPPQVSARQLTIIRD